MSNPCSTLPGWGSLSFGSGPWAGTVYVGTILPAYPPFDYFCLGPCGSLLTVTLYPEVEIGVGDQWTYDSSSDSIHIWSGASPTQQSRAYFDVTTGVPDEFSIQWRIRFDELPLDFSDITNRHIHIGAGSHQGYTCGLMFSAAGVAFVPREGVTSGVTPLPGSSALIELGQTYMIKIVAGVTTTYVYITKYTDYVQYGHILRYALASVAASDPPVFEIDKTWISVKGVHTDPHVDGAEADIWVGEYCLSSALLVSDYPPIADAGRDQAAQFCSIVQLDGSSSTDPEGLGLQYQWRLLDAPPTSGFVANGLLGQSRPLPVPTGYTTKWYCAQLSALPAGTIMAGDVLVIAGEAYDIAGLGTDGYGDYIQVTLELIPDSLPLQGFTVARQFGISGDTNVKPTFYSDVPGLYKFDLKVFDGSIWSTPSVVVVNVVLAVSPRGFVPDLKFIWEYLSDFWKLVDDKHRYSVVWSGLAQFLAAELLNLWQYEYSKSHRDIQRTMQRRWLSYSLRYAPSTLSTTTMRVVLSPYDSSQFDPAGVAGMVGKTLVVSVPVGDAITATFSPAASSTLTAVEIAAQLTAQLPKDFTAAVVSISSTLCFVRLAAPYPFTVIGGTAPIFSPAGSTSLMQGTGGTSLWGGTAYKVEDGVSLEGLGLQENDFLEVDGELYRIIKIQSSGTGLPGDVVVLKDTLPITAGVLWSVPSYIRYPTADFYNQMLASGDDVILQLQDPLRRLGYYTCRSLGSGAGDVTALAFDTAGLDQFLYDRALFTVNFSAVLRRSRVPINSLVVDIPYLQETLTDSPAETVLRRNLDFFIEEYRNQKCIRFDSRVWLHDEDGVMVADTLPVPILWAEATYIDNSPTIESNFGKPIGFTLENWSQIEADVDYLSAVRGLWYSHFNGPKLEILRIGAQILLGLPFAEEDGTIEELRDDYSPNTGRLLIRDKTNTQIVRSYTYPASLGLETNPATGVAYALGDAVVQFAPLVKGVELLDYVKDSAWMDLYASQGAGSYLHKFFRFLLRVDHGAFTLAAMLFARDFILGVKPTCTYPLFSVLYEADDATVDVEDTITHRVVTSIFDTPDGLNVATMYDQPEDAHDSVPKTFDRGPIGQAWKNSYDYGVGWRTGTVDWGYDRLCPRDELACSLCETHLSPFTPIMDGIFAYDLPVYDALDPGTPVSWTYDDTLPAGKYCRDKDL